MTMKLNGLLSPKAQELVEKTKQPTPKYHCTSCAKLTDGMYCTCYQRPVDVNYNKCYNHSHYSPRKKVFKAVSNLTEIVMENAKLKLA